MNLQLIVADNQTIFRTGVARVLSAQDGLEVVAQCADAERLKEAIVERRNAVVIFPSSIDRNLTDVLNHIEGAGSHSLMIIEHDAVLEDHLLDRVEGVVLRSVAGHQLVDCVRRIAAGGRCVPEQGAKNPPAPDRVGARVLERLTPKELQIVALVTEGAKNKEIATQLGTKEQVVKNYLRSIYDKTGVSDRLELALFTVHHRALAEAIEALQLQRTGKIA